MKKIKRIFVLVMVACLAFSKIDVEAADVTGEFQDVPSEQIDIRTVSSRNTNFYSEEESLTACELGIGISKNGIGVSFSTTSTTIATEIGCKDMVLQEKTLLGWKDIPIRDHYDYDTDVYTGSVVYLKAVEGKTYRVYCTHYAIINDIEYTLYNITDSIVYN